MCPFPPSNSFPSHVTTFADSSQLQMSMDKSIMRLVGAISLPLSIHAYGKQFPQIGYEEGGQSGASNHHVMCVLT